LRDGLDEPIVIAEAPKSDEMTAIEVEPEVQEQELGEIMVYIVPTNPLEFAEIILGLSLLRVACDQEK